MNLYGGRLYKIAMILANVFLLNLIWIICSLPLVALFPATAAMYSVVREWILHKDTSVFRLFFKYFKVNFKQSFLLSLKGVPAGASAFMINRGPERTLACGSRLHL